MTAFLLRSNFRFPISVAFSVAVHALLILGLVKTVPDMFHRIPQVMSLDVILAQKPKEQPPEQAYLNSDVAQLGALSITASSASTNARHQGSPVLSAESNAQFVVSPGFRDDDLWLKYHDRSVKRRTVSAASHEAKDAAYLARWREKIERLGSSEYQQNYHLGQGEVLMLVAIDVQGNLIEIQVRRSSGNEALDALAVSIVEHAAPFEPLTAEMQGDTEVLEIIRTWKFANAMGPA